MEYIRILTEEFEFKHEDLWSLWVEAHPEPVATADDITPKKLLGQAASQQQLSPVATALLKDLSRSELVDRCRQLGLKVSGKKAVLVERINDHLDNGGKDTVARVIPIDPARTKRKTKLKKMADILSNIMMSKEVINIRRNLFNNFEHMDTRIVFDEVSKNAIGVQNDDGTIAPLSVTDIQTCKDYGFCFDILPSMAAQNEINVDEKEE